MIKSTLNILVTSSVTPQGVYIDSSVLRGANFGTELAPLLHMSKADIIKVYIGETALWERSRQQHKKDENEIKNRNRLVPVPFPGINKYVAWFKQLFEQYGVRIIPSNDMINEKAREYLQKENTYFKIKNENDQRDAHILATAELNLDKKSCLILCNDIKLAECFKNIAGFSNVRQDYKSAISELIGEEMTFPPLETRSFDSLDEYQLSTAFTLSFCRFMQDGGDYRFNEYLTLPGVTNKLSAKLANMQVYDAEIRKRILGCIMWFDPLKKSDLHKLLEPNYEEAQIDSNAQLLKQESLIIETENNWLANIEQPEAREICQQAMAVVMPEILAMMELV